MYTLIPRACGHGPWDLGVHIRQITRACVTTIIIYIANCIFLVAYIIYMYIHSPCICNCSSFPVKPCIYIKGVYCTVNQ